VHSIDVKLPQGSYQVRVGTGLVSRLHDELTSAGLREPYFVISQPRVLKAAGAALKRKFHVVSIPDGERAKTLSTVNRLVDQMVKNDLNRQSTVVAFGGGVVGDVAAFVASVYMRGIAVVQVPTTLLAQVDSSIGGKTGVNHRVAKNLIGTFHQPSLVIADTAVLRTLPDREYSSGLYEAVKYGIIRDPRLFAQFEQRMASILRRDEDEVERLVAACVAIKAHVVMADEKESDLRRILNFGHTVGHALESAGKLHRIKHGEAVGYGMIAAARISRALGSLTDPDCARIEAGIALIGRLPRLASVRLRDVFDALQHDKKVRDGAIHFVLPRAIGKVEITPDVPLPLVRDVVRSLLDENR
jgi:3-dehydroquinate synthase